MEAELAKFRAQLKTSRRTTEEGVAEASLEPASNVSSPNLQRRHPSMSSRIVVTDEPIVDESPWRWTGADVAVFASKIVLWALLMTLAVVVEFGAVFFVATLFYLIFTNLRDRPRKRGELSAYSVFNPNAESIAGTVTAGDLEKQLQYGALH